MKLSFALGKELLQSEAEQILCRVKWLENVLSVWRQKRDNDLQMQILWGCRNI